MESDGVSGTTGDEDEEEDSAHKHTLRCEEVIFKLSNGTLVAAGFMDKEQRREEVTSVTFLRRTAKMRSNTLMSQVVRQTIEDGTPEKYAERDPITGEFEQSNLDPRDSNLFLDALIEITKVARVQEKCMFFSRAYGTELREVSARHVNEHVKEGAKRHGLSPDRYSSHSFKKAHIQILQAGKWTEKQQQKSVAHKAASSTASYRSKLAEGPYSTLFEAGGKRTVADNLAEQQLLDVGTALRLSEMELTTRKKARDLY